MFPRLALASLLPLTACDVGGVVASTETNVEGDNETNATVDDVAIDELVVDADTSIDVDANVEIDAFIGGGDDIVAGSQHARGDDVAFSMAYRGVIFEEARLTPSYAPGLAISSIEWLVRAPVFDEPTIVDDAAAFAWGEPDEIDADGDTFVLAALFGDDVNVTFLWDTQTRFCDGECAPRSISAVCDAEVVLRVWLTDGTSREAIGDHTSARVTCQPD